MKKGAQDAKQEYSGQRKPYDETMAFSVNHQVAPASGALGCVECHSATGRLDFASLGYNAEEVVRLTSMPAGQAPAEEPQAQPAEPGKGGQSTPSASPTPAQLPSTGVVEAGVLLRVAAMAGALLLSLGFFVRRRS